MPCDSGVLRIGRHLAMQRQHDEPAAESCLNGGDRAANFVSARHED